MCKKTHFTILRLLVSLIVSLMMFKTAAGQDSIHRSAVPITIQSSLWYNFPQSYGISAGIDYPFKSVDKRKFLKDGSQFIKHKDKLWVLQAGVYRYPFNHTGILLVPGIATRHYLKKTIFYETSLGIGLLRTFYDGKVYEVAPSGNVSTKPLFGRFYATTHLASSFDYILQKPGGKIIALQLKPSIWFQYPFESFIKPQVSIEAGIKYEIDKRSTKTRIKNKQPGR